nr:uncharacterized protein LOC111503496 [Leptinotarsa decemlineata]
MEEILDGLMARDRGEVIGFIDLLLDRLGLSPSELLRGIPVSEIGEPSGPPPGVRELLDRPPRKVSSKDTSVGSNLSAQPERLEPTANKKRRLPEDFPPLPPSSKAASQAVKNTGAKSKKIVKKLTKPRDEARNSSEDLSTTESSVNMSDGSDTGEKSISTVEGGPLESTKLTRYRIFHFFYNVIKSFHVFVSGLLSWEMNTCLVDLEKELAIITEQALEGEEARYGERLIQFASENLVTEILIHPVVSTLAQCMRNLLSSFTRHRHIIHSGYTFAANGSWALQDGTFSCADFSEAFQEIDVQRVIHAYENGISLDLHCSPEGDWTRLPKEPFAKACRVRINPSDVLTSGSPAIANFTKYLAPFLVPTSLENLLESSDVVGNIRFSRPTAHSKSHGRINEVPCGLP